MQHRLETWLEEEIRNEFPSGLIIESLEGEAIGLIVLSEYSPRDGSISLSMLIGEASERGCGGLFVAGSCRTAAPCGNTRRSGDKEVRTK